MCVMQTWCVRNYEGLSMHMPVRKTDTKEQLAIKLYDWLEDVWFGLYFVEIFSNYKHQHSVFHATVSTGRPCL